MRKKVAGVCDGCDELTLISKEREYHWYCDTCRKPDKNDDMVAEIMSALDRVMND